MGVESYGRFQQRLDLLPYHYVPVSIYIVEQFNAKIEGENNMAMWSCHTYVEDADSKM